MARIWRCKLVGKVAICVPIGSFHPKVKCRTSPPWYQASAVSLVSKVSYFVMKASIPVADSRPTALTSSTNLLGEASESVRYSGPALASGITAAPSTN